MVERVDQESKNFFVEKLGVYDELIGEKENKLKDLNEEIENKQKDLIEKGNVSADNGQFYYYDLKNVDYQDADIFNKIKKIEAKFNLDNVETIKKFIKENFKEESIDTYKKYVKVRGQFSSSVVYDLLTLREKEQIKQVLSILGDLNKVYDDYIKRQKKFELRKFLAYFDQLISDMDPYIYVYVGSDNENYDKLNKYIVTKIDDSIFKGITIIYKSKLYDYSI